VNPQILNNKISIRSCCRICKNLNLFLFLDFDKMPMPDGHIDPDDQQSVFINNLSIYWCPQCGIVQTLHDVDLSSYYSEYDYSVSHSQFTMNFMDNFATDVISRFNISTGDVIYEIGSGDGQQLSYFRNIGADVVGFEPSLSLASLAAEKGIDTIRGYFCEKNVSRLSDNMKKVKLIICQYTFDHIPDPLSFLEDISKVLDPEQGVAIFEVHDFEKIVERNEACLFTHEHFLYLTIESFRKLLNRCDFKIISYNFLSETICRGNSLIVAASLNSSNHESELIFQSNLLLELKNKERYIIFSEAVAKSHSQLKRFIHDQHRKGNIVAGYGAAGRGVNTLCIAGLTNKDIYCVFDINENLHGKLMPGSNVPVLPPSAIFDSTVDMVIVFSYGYLDEIRAALKPYLKKGGQMISILDLLK